MSTRIKAKLDVKPPYVVKPVHFEGLRNLDLLILWHRVNGNFELKNPIWKRS